MIRGLNFDPSKMLPGAHRALGRVGNDAGESAGASTARDPSASEAGAAAPEGKQAAQSGGGQAPVKKMTHKRRAKMAGRRRKPVKKVFTNPHADRSKVLNEFFTTEAMYVQILTQFVEKAIKPFLVFSRKALPDQLVRLAGAVCSGFFEQLEFHKGLYQSLQRAMTASSETKSVSAMSIFLQHREQFSKLYDTYTNIRGFCRRLDALNELQRHEQKSKKSVWRWMGALRKREQVDFADSLLMPFQRPQIYELIFRKYLQVAFKGDELSPDQQDDKAATEQALEVVTAFSQRASAKVNSQLEDAVKLLSWETRIIDCPLPLYHSLKGDPRRSRRRLLREGIAGKAKMKKRLQRSIERVLVLFSDALIWATPGDYKYKGHLWLRKGVTIEPHKQSSVKLTSPQVISKGKVVNPGSTWVLTFQSESDRVVWTDTIRRAIDTQIRYFKAQAEKARAMAARKAESKQQQQKDAAATAATPADAGTAPETETKTPAQQQSKPQVTEGERKTEEGEGEGRAQVDPGDVALEEKKQESAAASNIADDDKAGLKHVETFETDPRGNPGDPEKLQAAPKEVGGNAAAAASLAEEVSTAEEEGGEEPEPEEQPVKSGCCCVVM